jgi:hypothetical protein
MSVNVVLRLSRSQQMALVDILIAYMRGDDVQEFVDVSTDTTTTVGDLLRIVGDLRELEVVDEDHDGRH